MMAREPARRYQTCRELLKDLELLRESGVGGAGVTANADGVAERPARGGGVRVCGADDALAARSVAAPAALGRWR